MESTEIAKIARNHAVMVRAQGPDPKGLKMRRHAFHNHQDGRTTLSASGFLLPESLRATLPVLEKVRASGSLDGRLGAVVATVASVVECFLAVRQNAAESSPPEQVIMPNLIPGAHIDVLVDQGLGEQNGLNEHVTNPSWLTARLLALVNVSLASSALEQLVRRNGSPRNDLWDVGWSLTPLTNVSNSFVDVFNNEVPPDVSNFSQISSITTIAFLEVLSMDVKCPADIRTTLPAKGESLLVMGSPFGILSSSHFLNSVSMGSVANSCLAGTLCSPILLADIRCLPGMEGGPVYDQNGRIVGILTRPLRQKGSSVEIQLVITWSAIITACSLQQNMFHGSSEAGVNENFHGLENKQPDGSLRCQPDYPYSPKELQAPLEAALASVVLIAIGDGAWASGVLLNNNGLVLTNAHLLEPWKYGRGSLLSITRKSTSLQVPFERTNQKQKKTSDDKKKLTSQSPLLKASKNNLGDVKYNYIQDSRYRTYQKLRIRLNHTKPWIWVDAKVVYISQGPMDIALLQLEDIPELPVPMNVDSAPPTPGSKVHVIGHGPFGPQSD